MCIGRRLLFVQHVFWIWINGQKPEPLCHWCSDNLDREHNPAECYACVNYTDSMNREKNDFLKYIPTICTQLPLLHSNVIPVSTKPISTEQSKPSTLETMKTEETSVSMYEPSNVTAPCNHIEITQSRLNNMIRSLKLSQRQSIVLAKNLKQTNILTVDVWIYGAIKYHHRFTNFFNFH